MMKITQKEFELLTEFIKHNYGIYLKKEKETLLIGRLQKSIIDLGFDNFTDYYNYLLKDDSGKGITVLIDKISTNHTYFMREPEHFYFFRDKLLPDLKDEIKNRDLRIWCAASSSGEEPYTLAMILEDFFQTETKVWDKKLLATDISQGILDVAKLGIYEKSKIELLPKNWKLKYFEKIDGENFRVKNELKKEVIYRRFNLMDETFPFKKKFHVIFCRNVMIYFDIKTKNILVNKLYDLLEEGGYLFIGHSESLNRDTTRFKYIKPAIYRK